MTEGVLSGVRVLEFGGVGPGPYGGMLLADLGADVIRIERTEEAGSGEKRSILNRGKRSVAVDLRNPAALEVVRELVLSADVLVDPFRPGVMERLGLAPDVVHAWSPRLVYARMTGWGQDGPYARTAGHDLDYIAVTGLLHAIGEADGPPQVPLNIAGDFGGGGTFLVIGVLAGLLQARATGTGTVVDVAMVDGAASLIAGTLTMLNGGRWVDERGVNLLDGGAPFYSVYSTKDDRHLAVAPLEPKFFAEFVRVCGVDIDPAKQYDRSAWPAMRRAITDRIRSRSLNEWIDDFRGSDSCVAAVESLSTAASNEHLLARGTILRETGGLQPGIAPRIAGYRTVPPPLGSSPTTGAHTREVLDALGLDVDALVDEKVVAASDGDGQAVRSR
ncbi:CaiB/BaiF CoA transferase family protein [Nocardioides sp. NPDC051685]|uniref:CaiB/BaiF CoA transferase family protein n=1 Tax=Nocardioides sp. NPDC051685 TaxID=3364334 RepID=UPI0037A9EF71